MKKLMTLVVAVAVAAIAQAATVTWNSGSIYVSSDATGTASGGMANAGTRLVTAYLFELTAAEYASASSMSTADLYKSYSGKTATMTQNTTAAGSAIMKQTVADGSAAEPQTIYGLVLYVDTATAASYTGVDAFVKSALKTGTWQDTTGVSFTGLAGAKTTNWTAVAAPEPTSGLLFLLGMAGLALKRKRA